MKNRNTLWKGRNLTKLLLAMLAFALLIPLASVPALAQGVESLPKTGGLDLRLVGVGIMLVVGGLIVLVVLLVRRSSQ